MVGLVALAGCGAPEASQAAAPGEAPAPISSCGRDVTLEAAPTRILVHREMSTLVAAAGGADRIVARAGEAGVPLGPYADALADVPQLNETDMTAPDREVVLGEQADLVVAGRVQADYLDALEQVGVPAVVPPWFCSQVAPGNDDAASVGFDALYATIEEYGRAFGTEDVATGTVDELRERVAAVEQEMSGAPPRTVVNAWLGRETVTSVYGALSINNTVLTALGLTNMFEDMEARNPTVSFEAILGKDPDLIVVSYLPSHGYTEEDAVRAFSETPGADQLAAVRNGRVVAMNSGYLAGGPLAVDGLEMLAQRLAALD
ncbi:MULTISPECIES: ABC transporter substrate-binding protein [Pseudonocardia]|uniref:ABC transporter substrate-binding protein n=1 Tax=Pseudonocardia saturnea TaxID=33909 RepID=A0ABQ0RTE0_9PSEU|nr:MULTISPECIES: ABC transporter substrate-binding protein [Pseudonocardia]BBF99012.1 ABC transporter substrate-binding protein [Pseudonocardia autotrophica]GEC23932.1 ABC transporter substrate-binding protein [Pseudonocardia saturnea]